MIMIIRLSISFTNWISCSQTELCCCLSLLLLASISTSGSQSQTQTDAQLPESFAFFSSQRASLSYDLHIDPLVGGWITLHTKRMLITALELPTMNLLPRNPTTQSPQEVAGWELSGQPPTNGKGNQSKFLARNKARVLIEQLVVLLLSIRLFIQIITYMASYIIVLFKLAKFVDYSICREIRNKLQLFFCFLVGPQLQEYVLYFQSVWRCSLYFNHYHLPLMIQFMFLLLVVIALFTVKIV